MRLLPLATPGEAPTGKRLLPLMGRGDQECWEFLEYTCQRRGADPTPGPEMPHALGQLSPGATTMAPALPCRGRVLCKEQPRSQLERGQAQQTRNRETKTSSGQLRGDIKQV